MLGWKILSLSLSIVFIGCTGGGSYYKTSTNSGGYDMEYYKVRGLINLCVDNPDVCGAQSYPPSPPPSINSGYQPDVYMDNSQEYQVPIQIENQQQDESDNPWKYVQEEKPDPYFYINTQTGNSYMKFGDDAYIDQSGNTIRPFGTDWKIDNKGNTYMPLGDNYIDSKGNTLMPVY